MKRIRPAPMGRAFRYQRRLTHIILSVAERAAKAGLVTKVEEPAAAPTAVKAPKAAKAKSKEPQAAAPKAAKKASATKKQASSKA
jgi:large subunit ribosomal protein L22